MESADLDSVPSPRVASLLPSATDHGFFVRSDCTDTSSQISCTDIGFEGDDEASVLFAAEPTPETHQRQVPLHPEDRYTEAGFVLESEAEVSGAHFL